MAFVHCRLLNTIDAYRQEIHMQAPYLKDMSFTGDIINNQMQQKTIFSGSGDSFVSAMLAQYFSDGRARVIDPSDLLYNPYLTELRRLYLVSISGNTIANIRAAEQCSDCIAITASPNSRLARSTKGRHVYLNFPHTGVTTAGSISFVASALACISLVCDLSSVDLSGVHHIFERAKRDASEIKISGTLYILGNILTYPLAMYAAAKFYEVLGYDARYARIEQFSHMELFASCKDDTVLIFEHPNARTAHLADALADAHINAVVPSGASSEEPSLPAKGPKNTAFVADCVTQLLYYSFLSQILTLNIADASRLGDCHYFTASDLLRASNASIY